jgi:hypothetical protein
MTPTEALQKIQAMTANKDGIRIIHSIATEALKKWEEGKPEITDDKYKNLTSQWKQRKFNEDLKKWEDSSGKETGLGTWREEYKKAWYSDNTNLFCEADRLQAWEEAERHANQVFPYIKRYLTQSVPPYKEEVDKELQNWFDQHEYSPKSIKDIGDNYVINSNDVKELLTIKK